MKDSRRVEGTAIVRRRRWCDQCSHRFSTFEIVIPTEKIARLFTKLATRFASPLRDRQAR